MIGSIVIFISLFVLLPRYKFEYIYSKKNSNVLTQVDYWSIFDGTNTFLTPGIYKKREIPPTRIEPIYQKGLTDGFLLISAWHGDTCVVYSLSYECVYYNPVDTFKLIQIDITSSDEEKMWEYLSADTYDEFNEIFANPSPFPW